MGFFSENSSFLLAVQRIVVCLSALYASDKDALLQCQIQSAGDL